MSDLATVLRCSTVLVLFVACTAPSPSSPSSPLVRRYFATSNEAARQLHEALEPYGIGCGIEGGLGAQAHCEGTEQQWSDAESVVARFLADGTKELPDVPPIQYAITK